MPEPEIVEAARLGDLTRVNALLDVVIAHPAEP